MRSLMSAINAWLAFAFQPLVSTLPGMEMKVTPDSEVPIMAKATMYHGALRLAIKKLSLVARRDVSTAMTMRTAK